MTKALELAEYLTGFASGDGTPFTEDLRHAAAELRRLHEAHAWQYRKSRECLERIDELEATNKQLTHAAQQMLTVLESFVKWADPDCGDPTCDDCKAFRPVWAAIKAGKDALGETETKRPQNCGTGFCSCVECVMKEKPE